MIVSYELSLLLDKVYFSVVQRSKVHCLDYQTRIRIDLNHSVKVEDISPDVAIDKFELIQQLLVLPIGFLDLELAHLLKGIRIDTCYSI